MLQEGARGYEVILDSLRYSSELWNLWVSAWARCGNTAVPADLSSDTAKQAKHLHFFLTDRYLHPVIDDLLKRLRLARGKGAPQVALRTAHKAAAAAAKPKGLAAVRAAASKDREAGGVDVAVATQPAPPRAPRLKALWHGTAVVAPTADAPAPPEDPSAVVCEAESSDRRKGAHPSG